MCRASGALLLVALLSAHARGDDDNGDDEGPRWGLAAVESALVLGIPALSYYAFQDNSENYVLDWDWSSWEAKLDGSALRFDTDTWGYNTLKHPAFGVLMYRTGRSNNFGVWGSIGVTAVDTLVWEYVLEYREYPSINDMVVNVAAGVEIGEPLYQIAQLWRGGTMSAGDYVKSTLFSPIGTVNDVITHHVPRFRPVAWRSIVVEGGGLYRELPDGHTRTEGLFTADIDLVADRNYLSDGASSGSIKPGSWSRIRGSLGTTDNLTSMRLSSRTTLAGRYAQDDAGDGTMLGIGTAFSYRRDRFTSYWDHFASMGILGPQLQLSRRTPELAVRWDAAAYGDFAMVDAHVFAGEHPFPPAPPYISSLQARGYYYAYGATGTTRLRIETPALSIDLEGELHRLSQINDRDRVAVDTSAPMPETAHHNTDWRAYWRGELAFHYGQWALGAEAEGSTLSGNWRTTTRTDSELAFGGFARADL